MRKYTLETLPAVLKERALEIIEEWGQSDDCRKIMDVLYHCDIDLPICDVIELVEAVEEQYE